MRGVSEVSLIEVCGIWVMTERENIGMEGGGRWAVSLTGFTYFKLHVIPQYISGLCALS